MRYLGLVGCWAADVSERQAIKGVRSIETKRFIFKYTFYHYLAAENQPLFIRAPLTSCARSLQESCNKEKDTESAP